MKDNKILIRFTCYVVQIRRKYFVAIVSEGGCESEEAEFRLSDFPKGQIELGTIFYWTIYKNYSKFKLYDKKWTKKDFENGKKMIKKLEEIGWSSND